jgi:hypothetical protein
MAGRGSAGKPGMVKKPSAGKKVGAAGKPMTGKLSKGRKKAPGGIKQ